MDFTSKDVRVSETAILIDGVPDCFITSEARREYFEKCFNTPIDVNLDGDAYSTSDEDETWPRVAIDFDCTAWE